MFGNMKPNGQRKQNEALHDEKPNTHEGICSFDKSRTVSVNDSLG